MSPYSTVFIWAIYLGHSDYSLAYSVGIDCVARLEDYLIEEIMFLILIDITLTPDCPELIQCDTRFHFI